MASSKLEKSINQLQNNLEAMNNKLNALNEKLQGISHYENSSNPHERLAYLDTLREIKLLEMQIPQVKILISEKEEGLSYEQDQNQPSL